MQCNPYIKSEQGTLERCIAEGRERVDNGLSIGIHCRECYRIMVAEVEVGNF